ncbi:hypothetical protein OE09_2144 [Flavobacteriaceae bacterium MAR_2010_72]|nr:hypothetical protein OE09_2144 [Flavobacteriaceae bacterium MAR_2010_72]
MLNLVQHLHPNIPFCHAEFSSASTPNHTPCHPKPNFVILNLVQHLFPIIPLFILNLFSYAESSTSGPLRFQHLSPNIPYCHAEFSSASIPKRTPCHPERDFVMLNLVQHLFPNIPYCHAEFSSASIPKQTNL